MNRRFASSKRFIAGVLVIGLVGAVLLIRSGVPAPTAHIQVGRLPGFVIPPGHTIHVIVDALNDTGQLLFTNEEWDQYGPHNHITKFRWIVSHKGLLLNDMWSENPELRQVWFDPHSGHVDVYSVSKRPNRTVCHRSCIHYSDTLALPGSDWAEPQATLPPYGLEALPHIVEKGTSITVVRLRTPSVTHTDYYDTVTHFIIKRDERLSRRGHALLKRRFIVRLREDVAASDLPRNIFTPPLPPGVPVQYH